MLGPAQTRTSPGTRFGILLAGAVLLAGLTAIVLIGTGSSSEEDTGAPAPPRCLEAWNSDSLAIEYGRHNSLGHGYSDAQVGRMPREGSASLSSKPDAGECAVVFAAEELDPEPVAAGQIELEGEWVPLSSLLESAALAELQSAAVGGANATLTEEGDLIE